MLLLKKLIFIFIPIIHAATELYYVKYSDHSQLENVFDKYRLESVSVSSTTTTSTGLNIPNNRLIAKQSNKLDFDLTCNGSNKECEGVRQTLTRATDIISSLFEFETSLLINASYLNFCQVYHDCQTINKVAGEAYPSISYVMIDNSDNMTRLYPQALLKQFVDLNIKPNWLKYDIQAQFNSQLNWYFINDQTQIKKNEVDFLTTCIHEIMHGLGFMTSWDDTFYESLKPLFDENNLSPFITPNLLASVNNPDLLYDCNETQPFWGFVEFPLDKFVYFKEDDLSEPKSFSHMTNQLNEFQDSNVLFRNLVDLANTWYASSQYGLASYINTILTTSLDVFLMISDDEPLLWLETSIYPFSSGSSLCHVDKQYTNSDESLMVYVTNRGPNLAQDSTAESYPLGPKLLYTMASLGYRINSTTLNPTRPDLTYWAPSAILAGSHLNPSPSLAMNTNGPAHSPSVTISISQTNSQSKRQIQGFYWLGLLLSIILSLC